MKNTIHTIFLALSAKNGINFSCVTDRMEKNTKFLKHNQFDDDENSCIGIQTGLSLAFTLSAVVSSKIKIVI